MPLGALKVRFRVIHVYDLWVLSVAALGLAAVVRIAGGGRAGTLWWLAAADAVAFGSYFVAADAIDRTLGALGRSPLVPDRVTEWVGGARQRLGDWDAYGR